MGAVYRTRYAAWVRYIQPNMPHGCGTFVLIAGMGAVYAGDMPHGCGTLAGICRMGAIYPG
jgi:hypothetical protein